MPAGCVEETSAVKDEDREDGEDSQPVQIEAALGNGFFLARFGAGFWPSLASVVICGGVGLAVFYAASRALGIAETRSVEIRGQKDALRTLLANLLRDELGLTGTHIGCDTSNCGTCTVLLDGHSVRACLMLAVQANGHEITTIEGIAQGKAKLHPLQEAFAELGSRALLGDTPLPTLEMQQSDKG